MGVCGARLSREEGEEIALAVEDQGGKHYDRRSTFLGPDWMRHAKDGEAFAPTLETGSRGPDARSRSRHTVGDRFRRSGPVL